MAAPRTRFSPRDILGSASDQRTTLLVWGVLSAVTVAARLLSPGHSHATTDPNTLTAAAVAVLGLIKCRLITGHFMEVRHAPRRLRVAIDIWLAALWSALTVLYLW